MLYDYQMLEVELEKLQRQYSFIKIHSIGKSIQNREIYCVSLGEGKRKIHANASHHANEWITSVVLMQSIDMFCKAIKGDVNPLGSELSLKNVAYDFIPMVNPDGVEICIHGLEGQENSDFLYEANGYSHDFSRWRSNARGVDLNRNYDADFDLCKKLSGLERASYGYYQGQFPLSENETKAMAALTQKQNYDLVLAYHTQGEEIYWQYKDYDVLGARQYAKAFSEASGYQLGVPEASAIAGGYKDWFIGAFKKPGFTIECGVGTNPIETNQLPTILRKTLPILYIAGKEFIKN
ncbi:MAG: M14 family zinc carboxypeptidase [Cellulosilyticaceae bacterium]